MAVCAEVPGARLCTVYEALNDCLRGTGCGFDDDLVWTATAEADVVGGTVPPFDPDIDGDWTTVFVNDFDDGTWQDFAPGGELATLNANRLRTFGLSPGSVRLVDNSGMDSSALLNLTAAAGGAFAASPYDVHRVRFWWHVRSFENVEDFYLEYCPDDPAACEAGTGGSAWVQLGRWEHCCTEADTSAACDLQTACDFDNEDMGFHAISLPTGTGGGGGGDPHLRFRSDSSGTGDYLYIDQVEIQGKGTGELAPSTSPSASPSASPTAEPSVTTSDGPSAVPVSTCKHDDMSIYFDLIHIHIIYIYIYICIYMQLLVLIYLYLVWASHSLYLMVCLLLFFLNKLTDLVAERHTQCQSVRIAHEQPVRRAQPWSIGKSVGIADEWPFRGA